MADKENIPTDSTVTESEYADRPRLGRYTAGEAGAVEWRTAADYQRHFDEGIGLHPEMAINVHDAISGAVEDAIEHGREEVVVFDFGCGRGAFMQSIMTDPQYASLLARIEQAPGLRVRIIGLTDLPSGQPDEEGLETVAAQVPSGVDLKDPEAPPKNLSIHMDYYAIDATHTLGQYLENIQHLDVALAVHSLTYLPPDNYEATIATIIDKLRPGVGVFAAVGHMSTAGGFTRDLTPGAEKAFGITRRHDDKDRDPSIGATMIERGDRFRSEDADIDLETELLVGALERYKELEVLDDAAIAKQVAAVVGGEVSGGNYESVIKELAASENRDALARLSDAVFADAEDRLGWKRLAENQSRRFEKLSGVYGSASERVDMRVSPRTILVRAK